MPSADGGVSSRHEQKQQQQQQQRGIMEQNRFSWNPEWMNSLNWLDQVELPIHHHIDDDSESDEGHSDTSSEASEMGWDSLEEDEWVPFFANVCKAITHSTPWSNQSLSPDVRQKVLTHVVKRFLERCEEQRAIGKRMKVILANVMKEDKVSNIQSLYVEYTDQHAWRGFDDYRMKANWFSEEKHKKFKDECLEQVEHRLHMINVDTSRKEARVIQAIEIWNEVHASDECFGGLLTMYLKGISTAKLQESGRVKLPKRVTAIVSVKVKGVTRAESIVRKAGVFDEEAQSYEWEERAPVALNLGNEPSEIRVNDAFLVITLTAKEMCGVCRPMQVGTVSIPLAVLYDDVLPLDDKIREEELDGEFGIHVSSRHFMDKRTNLSANVTLTLRCLSDLHNQQLPSVDVVREQERRRKVSNAVNSDIWKLDHHAAFVRLSDLLGDLEDADCLAMDMYADRFLIHEELKTVAVLAAAVTKRRFSTPDEREVVRMSLQELRNMRPNVETRACGEWIDDVILKARKATLDRVMCMEDVTDDPLDAKDVFWNCKHILVACGISEKDLSSIVDRRAAEDVKHLTKKIEKLTRFVPQGADVKRPPPGGMVDRRPTSPENDAAADAQYALDQEGNRVSVLLELDQQSDRAFLVAKSRVLFQLADLGLTSVINALEFGKGSGDPAVLGVALIRSRTYCEALIAAVQMAVVAIIGELAQSLEPDPLGDTFGMLTLLYERVMKTVEVIGEHETLESLCLPMVRVFEGYLPGWFSLCREKVYSWIRGIVREEPLVAISPGRVYCNQAPSDASNLLYSLAEVFQRVLTWVDPEIAPAHVISFAKVVASIVEEFMSVMKAKGNTANESSEMCVAISSLRKFNGLADIFWKQAVFEDIVDEFEDDDRVLESQIKILMKQCAAHIGEVIDEYTMTIKGKFREWMHNTFEFQGNRVRDSVVDEEFCDFVQERLDIELGVIIANLEPTIADGIVLPVVGKAAHEAFRDYVALKATAAIKEGRVRTCELLLATLDRVLEEKCAGRLTADLLFDLSRKSRNKILLAKQPSSTLIRSLEDTEDISLSENERQAMLSILMVRVDGDAQAYLKAVKQQKRK